MNRNKLWLAAVGLILLNGGAFAQFLAPPEPVEPMIAAGARQLTLGGQIDKDGNAFGLALQGRGGIFVEDLIQVGGFGDFLVRGRSTVSMLFGVFGEHSFYLDSPLVPYAGGGLGLGWRKTRQLNDVYLALTLWGGARYFFVDHAALGCELGLSFATADVYNGNKDAVDWVLRLVTSWYFF